MKIVNYIVKTRSGRVITKGICSDNEKFEKIRAIYEGANLTVEEINTLL